jgi:flagellar motility protein MotE (MotC chaperone)
MENESIDLQEKKSVIGKLMVLILVLLIIISIFSALIKFDVANIGSKYAYPLLKDIPVVNLILPTKAEETISSEQSQIIEYAFENVDEAVERLKVTETLLKDKEIEIEKLLEQVKLLQDENARLKVFEENQVKFDERKKEFDELVVLGEGVPDIKQFRAFYEEIKPENAADIYEQVIIIDKYNEEVLNIASSYQQMKPSNAALILSKMTTSSSKMKMVVQILNNIDTEQRGAILSAMDTKVAARITEYMFPTN